ncbi:MAG: SMC-Scp complex subunit ScpB [bacterium]
MNLAAKIEAILFWKGEPISLKKLCQFLNTGEEEIKAGLEELEANLKSRGIVLIRKDDEVMLGTSPEIGTLIEDLTKEELTKDLGKAGLETLSIVLYKGPIRRSQIDYIRGVNSNFILRNLLIRGLVEKISDPKDQRSFLYRPTFEVLSYLGLSKTEDLPEYSQVTEEIEQFVEATEKEEEKKDEGL